MDKEDKRRYFIVGSVYLEVVTPLFQQVLEHIYMQSNFRCLQDFLDFKPVIHTLYHLRHRNSICCIDKTNCMNKIDFMISCHEWKQLYADIIGQIEHNCFCSYTAKSVSLEELDASLCGVILLNCCNLSDLAQKAVNGLRQFKNDYLSHNTTCGISADEYDTVWTNLIQNVLQLDPSKEDQLIRIQHRPLDDSLCSKYMTTLLDINDKLERIDTNIELSTALTLDTININGAKLFDKLEKYIQKSVCQTCGEKIYKQEIRDQPVKPYKLVQPIFTLHQQKNLTSVVGNNGRWGLITDIVLMDDGRLVMCLPDLSRLLICITDGSQVDSIDVQGQPICVTLVNNFTVAVTLWFSKCIDLYDIHNKLKLQSISVPRMSWLCGITTINNKLVVCGYKRLLIIDHQTGTVVKTIQIDCEPQRLHSSNDRIIYCDNNINNLYWYSNTDNSIHILTLPSKPYSMTTLQDGSLYVGCKDGSVQHVSSDGKHYKTVTTKGLQKLKCALMSYNSKQRKLVTSGDQRCILKVFNEK